ncbi:hypothetical protein NGM37_00130, partial [Streptomyces sp. TRM76130]|nr:hypothetical protein [Streptomyces sp. TRM76130]
LRLLGVTDGVRTRADLGVGLTTITGDGGESGASLTFGVNATGLVAPGLAPHGGHHTEVKGLAPLFTVTAGTTRGWHHRLTSQPLTHVILNT